MTKIKKYIFSLFSKQDLKIMFLFTKWVSAQIAQWVRLLDYLTTHTSLTPIRRGCAPRSVNYKKGALDSQVIKFTSCLPMWPAMTFPGLWRWNVIKRKTSPKCDVAKAGTCHIVNYIFYYPSQKTCMHTRMLIIYSRYTLYYLHICKDHL